MKKPMKKFKRYEGGGTVMGEMDPKEAAAKEAGLKASKGEDVGFFERMRMGNIDQPGSEAYNRFGAGRGRATPAPAAPVAPAAPAVAPAVPSMPAASSRALSDDMYSDFGPSAGRSSSETITPTRPMATKPVATARPPARPPATPVPPLSNAGPMRGMRSDASSPQYAGPMRGMRSDSGTGLPVQSGRRPQEEAAADKMDIKGMNDKAKKAMADDPSSLMGMAGAGAAALFGASRLGKMFKGAKKVASASRDLVTSPAAKSAMGKADDAKAAKAYDKLKKSSFTKGDDVTDVVAKKRGGAVKKYASGGMVSSASRRADGIATKGKTRGKMC